MSIEIAKYKLDRYIQKGRIPNLLIHGYCQNGKNEVYKYFLRSLYPNPTIRKKYILKINCFETNGIKFIKDIIKPFAQRVMHKKDGCQFKTILLLNANHLTHDAQYSLRRTIEEFSITTRFILVCNNKENLLSPICSRFVHIYVNDEPEKNNIGFHCLNRLNKTKIDRFYNSYMEICNNGPTAIQLLDMSNEMYNNNIYALELLPRFKNHPNYFLINSVIKEVSKNLKSEPLIILFVLFSFSGEEKLLTDIIR